MSMVPRCVRCDRKMDAYGRDGAMCQPCVEELLTIDVVAAKEALKHTIGETYPQFCARVDAEKTAREQKKAA